MKFNSVWKSSARSYPALNKNIARKTVVVGGGIAGFLTAFKLWEKGQDVTLIEADKLFSGTTEKTTAKISCNQETVYFRLYEKYGKTAAKEYYHSQRAGRDRLINLIKTYGIDCDLMPVDSYIFAYDECDLKENFKLLNYFGADCVLTDNTPFDGARKAIVMHGEYVFDPLKFLSGLPVGFEVYEHTRAIDVDCNCKVIETERADIAADNIIIATHYPIINTHGGYIYKLRQSESYLAAVPKEVTDNAYLDERSEGLTVRPYRGGTIIGGGDHRTGRIKDVDRLGILKEHAEKYLDCNKFTNFWNAEDVMTADGMPMAGKYWADADGIYVITGFNKWGMTNAAVCADIIADAVRDKKNKFFELFSPQRKIRGGFIDYSVNALTTLKDVVTSYIIPTFKSVDDVEKGSGDIVRYEGKKRAVYRDFDDRLYAIGSTCPHMHGELKWNPASSCWECPCHGSRFDKYGNVISSPATKGCRLFTDEKK